MKYHKKLFKHGGSLAVVIPSEFAEQLHSEEVTLEMRSDLPYPVLLITPKKSTLDAIEQDPLFEIFIQALYKHAMENPTSLKDGAEIWNDKVKKLIEGVSCDDEE